LTFATPAACPYLAIVLGSIQSYTIAGVISSSLPGSPLSHGFRMAD
jgi:hypothetical protein